MIKKVIIFTTAILLLIPQVTEAKTISLFNGGLEPMITITRNYVKKAEKQPKEGTTYYISAESGVNVRRMPTKSAKVVEVLPWSTKVKLYEINSKNFLAWKNEKTNTITGYIHRSCISKHKPKYQHYDISSYMLKTKTYTDMRLVNSRNTDQWKLRQLASIGPHGVMTVNGRYCVALGSRFKCKIGQYFDIILSNGNVVHCIKCDAKADKHTDPSNTYTFVSKCATEFYVCTPCLDSEARNTGNLNYISEFQGYVEAINVYRKKVKL